MYCGNRLWFYSQHRMFSVRCEVNEQVYLLVSTKQCALLVLLLPVWYQGVVTMEEVRVTLTL